MGSVEVLLGRIQEAWNRGDVTAYASCYAEDAGYVTRAGALVVGRSAIEEVHREAFAGPLAGTQLKVALKRVAPLSERTFVAHADIELHGATTVWAVSTFVVHDGLIAAAQTTEI